MHPRSTAGPLATVPSPLATHDCTYVYTGLETASSEILAAIGKPHLNREIALERGLEEAGHELDFYRVPRCETFDALEDGGVGYNCRWRSDSA